MSFLSFRTSEFYPLTLSMPLEDMLFGIYTLGSRWKKIIKAHHMPANLWIEPTVLPDNTLIEIILTLKENQILKKNGLTLAAHLNDQLHAQMIETQSQSILDQLVPISYNHSCELISSLQYIIDHNKDRIIQDWQNKYDTQNWTRLSPWKNTYIKQNVDISEVCIDDRGGPVIIHGGVVILQGAKIMGPIVLMPGTVVKMGAELYPGSTFGRHTTVSGEIKNSIIHEYSAKGHTGYLGDSILGRWNNFGAGTTVSNVTNTFSKAMIKNWNTGENIIYESIKRGLVTGDFVKLGILSKVYRGSSIGSFTSIATEDTIKGNIPEMSWWTENHIMRYDINKLRSHCMRQMELHEQTWTEDWERALTQLMEANKNHNKQIEK